jgi:hypothetical protein
MSRSKLGQIHAHVFTGIPYSEKMAIDLVLKVYEATDLCKTSIDTSGKNLVIVGDCPNAETAEVYEEKVKKAIEPLRRKAEKAKGSLRPRRPRGRNGGRRS